MKNLLRSLTPPMVLNAFRKLKRRQKRKELQNQKEKGEIIRKSDLIHSLKQAGIPKGATLLVHSSMSKIGYLEEGPKTFVDALLETIGDSGNLLMPTSPNPKLQLNYIRENPIFDVLNSPSAMGAITEYFRKLPGVKRSLNPTEPVATYGPQAKEIIEGHLYEITPYTHQSPFYKVVELKGFILYVGVTLDNAGTSLHLLEDAVDFKFQVYYPELFPVEVIDEQGKSHQYKIKVHHPEMSKKRRCDELLPTFEKEGIMKRIQIGKANALIFDAKAMFDFMIEAYHSKGVTMYTPYGENE